MRRLRAHMAAQLSAAEAAEATVGSMIALDQASGSDTTRRLVAWLLRGPVHIQCAMTYDMFVRTLRRRPPPRLLHTYDVPARLPTICLITASVRAHLVRDRRSSPAPRPHTHIPTSQVYRTARSAQRTTTRSTRLRCTTSPTAPPTRSTTGDLLLPWMRESDFAAPSAPSRTRRAAGVTFDAVSTLFRLMIPVAAAVPQMARAAGYTLGCAHAACCRRGRRAAAAPARAAFAARAAARPAGAADDAGAAQPAQPAAADASRVLRMQRRRRQRRRQQRGRGRRRPVAIVAAADDAGRMRRRRHGLLVPDVQQRRRVRRAADAGGGTCDAGRGLAWRPGGCRRSRLPRHGRDRRRCGLVHHRRRERRRRRRRVGGRRRARQLHAVGRGGGRGRRRVLAGGLRVPRGRRRALVRV